MLSRLTLIGLTVLLATLVARAEQADPARSTRDATQDTDAADERPRIRGDATRDENAADDQPRIRNEPVRQRRRDRSSDPDATDNRAAGRRGNQAPLRDRTRDALPRKTMVLRLQHAPAADAGEVISDWLDSERENARLPAVTIVPAIHANSLVVTGPGPQLQAIQQIIEQLDLPPQQIRVRTSLVDVVRTDASEVAPLESGIEITRGALDDVLADLSKRGSVQVICKPELRTTNNQPASLQFGNRVPRVVGSISNSRGRSDNAEIENIGTVLSVTPRVSDDNAVIMDIDFERSYLGPERISKSPEGISFSSPEVRTVTIQSTVSLRSGECVLLGGMAYHDSKHSGELLLLLQPEIVE